MNPEGSTSCSIFRHSGNDEQACTLTAKRSVWVLNDFLGLVSFKCGEGSRFNAEFKKELVHLVRSDLERLEHNDKDSQLSTLGQKDL